MSVSEKFKITLADGQTEYTKPTKHNVGDIVDVPHFKDFGVIIGIYITDMKSYGRERITYRVKMNKHEGYHNQDWCCDWDDEQVVRYTKLHKALA